MSRLVRQVPASSTPTPVTTRSAPRPWRTRLWRECSVPPPCLRLLRSTPPVFLQSVRHVPACRAVRRVPQHREPREPPYRYLFRRPSPLIGIHRCRNGSRPPLIRRPQQRQQQTHGPSASATKPRQARSTRGCRDCSSGDCGPRSNRRARPMC